MSGVPLHLIDHLVYAAPDLQRGIDAFAALTGVVATPGGQHPGRGTCNALVALGAKMYLEIIAPDPTQPAPRHARWLGVDAVQQPRLTTWAAHGAQLSSLVANAARHAVTLGAVRTGARTRADGVQLSWGLTEPDPMVCDGIVPFFIDWGTSPHPSATAADGVMLVALQLEHPAAERVQRMLDVLHIDAIVREGPDAALVATLETPWGRVLLR